MSAIAAKSSKWNLVCSRQKQVFPACSDLFWKLNGSENRSQHAPSQQLAEVCACLQRPVFHLAWHQRALLVSIMRWLETNSEQLLPVTTLPPSEVAVDPHPLRMPPIGPADRPHGIPYSFYNMLPLIPLSLQSPAGCVSCPQSHQCVFASALSVHLCNVSAAPGEPPQLVLGRPKQPLHSLLLCPTVAPGTLVLIHSGASSSPAGRVWARPRKPSDYGQLSMGRNQASLS